MIANPSPHSRSHGACSRLDSWRHTVMTMPEIATVRMWMLLLGSSATPRDANAASSAAAGTIAIRAGLTDRSLASPRLSTGVRIIVAIIHMPPERPIAMNATANTSGVHPAPPSSASIVPAARLAEAVSVAAEPTRPMRTSTAGVPKRANSATATMTTASDGPIAAIPPDLKHCLRSLWVKPRSGPATGGTHVYDALQDDDTEDGKRADPQEG